MAAKKSTEVLIGGKVFTISGYEDENYLRKVAAYINGMLSEYEGLDEWKRLPNDMKSTLIAINIADDYFKAKALAEKYESDVSEKEKEVYDLKHELIGNQMKMESLEDDVRKLEDEKKELLLNKAKLEASLEDALLGPSTEGDS